MAIENDIFLLGFVGVCPVDLLRNALNLLFGYGITAVGEALWEELGEGWPQSQREAGSGRKLSVCIPSWAPSRSQHGQRGATVGHPSGSPEPKGPVKSAQALPTECPPAPSP